MLTVHLLAFISVINGGAYSSCFWVILAYLLRLFFVAAGNHRYFSHKSFDLNRFFQFIFALGSTLAMHNSIFWWASKHRQHHKYQDKNLDPHSHKRGFFWSHIGWVLHDDNAVDESLIKDLTKFKELVFLNTYFRQVNIGFAFLFLTAFGFNSFCSVYCLSLTLSWTTMFSVNSFGHKFGYRNFKVKDESTNIVGLSLLSLGESLHNNHHANPYSPSNRKKWFEIDLTFLVLCLLSLIKVVKFRRKVQ